MNTLKRLIQTFKSGILYTALIHIAILVTVSIMKADIIYLNYFNILDIDLFIPSVIKGVTSQILSFATIILILTTIYIIQRKKA